MMIGEVGPLMVAFEMVNMYYNPGIHLRWYMTLLFTRSHVSVLSLAWYMLL